MEFLQKLQHIQTDLKAPKNLYNSFGKYKYRNAEGICEAVKPLLETFQLVLFLSDEIIMIGDRYYVKATATIQDAETSKEMFVSAFARESFDKKGQDDSQITGTASSYARKYALNGLFLLDDTKDADTDEYHEQTNGKGTKRESANINATMVTELKTLCEQAQREESYIAKAMGVDSFANLPKEKYASTKAGLLKIINSNREKGE